MRFSGLLQSRWTNSPGHANTRRRARFCNQQKKGRTEGNVYSFLSSLLLLKYLPGEAQGVVADAQRGTLQEPWWKIYRDLSIRGRRAKFNVLRDLPIGYHVITPHTTSTDFSDKNLPEANNEFRL
jgi:hypothetical protein